VKEAKKNPEEKIKKKEIREDNLLPFGGLSKDVLVASPLFAALVSLIYLINLLQDTLSRHFILMFVFSFFVVLIALLVKKIAAIPIVLFAVSLATIKIGVFNFKGTVLVYTFLIMGIGAVLLFYLFDFLLSWKNASMIAGMTSMFSLMPLIESLLISPTLTKVFMYEIINILLMNLFISFLGSLIAVIVWHRARITKVILRLGN